MDCAIVGDSIAIGMARANHRCHSSAVSGITSWAYESRFPGRVEASRVLISLGSNDGHADHSEQALRRLRERVNSPSVTWLLSPNNRRARDAAVAVARAYGDRVIEVRPFVGNDGVHPTPSGYSRLSSAWNHSR